MQFKLVFLKWNKGKIFLNLQNSRYSFYKFFLGVLTEVCLQGVDIGFWPLHVHLGQEASRLKMGLYLNRKELILKYELWKYWKRVWEDFTQGAMEGKLLEPN